MKTPYIQQSLTYTDDGRLMDSNGYAVMMEWEAQLMKAGADTICKNGGRVLNVGFGMGIIDSYIQEHNVEEHWIIELHPDVYTKMLKDGWHLKKNVKILFGDWRHYLQYLPKFDGVYIDTWDEVLYDFHAYVHNILKPNGIYSYFNNPRGDAAGIHTDQESYDILSKNFNMEYDSFEIEKIDSIERQTATGQFYWHPDWKTYYSPKFSLVNSK